MAIAIEIEELEVPVNDQELFVTRYPASGQQLIIWVAPGYGSHQRSAEISKQLVKRGVEVWHVDLADSLFLPKNTSTMRSIKGSYIAGLIDAAYKATGKTITLLTRSYGALPLLRGARAWQQRHLDDGASYLNGAILFSPEMYETIPALGLPPIYADITYASNIPIMLYQAGNRSNRWQLEGLLKNLEKGGAPVFVRFKQGVTGLFYLGDTSTATKLMLARIPDELTSDLVLLNKLPVPTDAAKLLEDIRVKSHGLDSKLKLFKGESLPLPLDLMSATGTRFIRDDYKGKVTLVNFWASWCPPCVEEIPSLNNLRQTMQGKPFELISVNYAEDKQRVEEFLKRVDVDFPVLLDETGRVSADWNVLVYPSTFVISPNGKITHGVNGAILWDSPEVVNQLNELLK
ncbi:MAG: TlpA family protein disulfide reductase [Sulfuriflexus sp.]|nr:TlpA family protein disulfide reductase [Sulfuriflexus sp.]